MIVKVYLQADGSSPFENWLKNLDGSIRYRIQARIFRLKKDGHFGVNKSLSDNLFELKFKKIGGGTRIYYGIDGQDIIILLCGGNKSTQTKDIKLAQKYWEEYKNRKD